MIGIFVGIIGARGVNELSTTDIMVLLNGSRKTNQQIWVSFPSTKISLVQEQLLPIIASDGHTQSSDS